MMAVLLIAGIGFVLAGLVAIVFGLPVKEFSFGNTLILTGVVGACTGMIMLGLWMVVRELKNIAQRLGPAVAAETQAEPSAVSIRGNSAREDEGMLFSRDQPASDHTGRAGNAGAAAQPPWHEGAPSRDRVRGDAPPPAPESAETAPAGKARRNLLFASSLRRDRERAQGRPTDPSAADHRSAPPPSESDETSGTFEDAWPKLERAPPLPRRSSRTPSTFTETDAGAPAADRHPPAPRQEEPPPVTVLRSGVVDGMAYSLYSDGSIEAQMPEGMMRFASIEELRAHLDQRS